MVAGGDGGGGDWQKIERAKCARVELQVVVEIVLVDLEVLVVVGVAQEVKEANKRIQTADDVLVAELDQIGHVLFAVASLEELVQLGT